MTIFYVMFWFLLNIQWRKKSTFMGIKSYAVGRRRMMVNTDFWSWSGCYRQHSSWPCLGKSKWLKLKHDSRRWSSPPSMGGEALGLAKFICPSARERQGQEARVGGLGSRVKGGYRGLSGQHLKCKWRKYLKRKRKKPSRIIHWIYIYILALTTTDLTLPQV